MSEAFVDVGMSLDGGTRIHQWLYPLATFHQRMGLSGGKTGPDDEIVQGVFARTGSYVMGRRMFDEGEVGWPEHAPFQAPVFVLTHQPREPWVRKGGTTFYFVTDGILSALQQAEAAAGGKDVRVSGGANLIQQYLQARLVDELTIHVAPIVLGQGVRLFDQATFADGTLQPTKVVGSPSVTHLTFRVVKDGAAG
jgi:dihydrofolate reductase